MLFRRDIFDGISIPLFIQTDRKLLFSHLTPSPQPNIELQAFL